MKSSIKEVKTRILTIELTHEEALSLYNDLGYRDFSQETTHRLIHRLQNFIIPSPPEVP